MRAEAASDAAGRPAMAKKLGGRALRAVMRTEMNPGSAMTKHELGMADAAGPGGATDSGNPQNYEAPKENTPFNRVDNANSQAGLAAADALRKALGSPKY